MYVAQHQIEIPGQPPCNVLEHESVLKLKFDRAGSALSQPFIGNHNINVEYFLLGISPVSELSESTFGNLVSGPSY
jgi:hypothetical protein